MPLLATLENINSYLPQDKVVADSTNTDDVGIAAERVIKGYLSGIFAPIVLAGWIDDTTTPQVIQDIYSKLIAAFLYRKYYSEDIPEAAPYAQELYKEAMTMITDVRAGTLVISEVDAEFVNTSIEFTNLDFLPNDATTPGAQFTMSMEF